MNGKAQARITAQTTRPWAEAYQAASQRHGACMPAPMSSEDDGSQQPTHDALSDTDNRKV